MNQTWKRAAASGVLCVALAAGASANAQSRPAGPGGQPPGARAAEHQKMFEEFRHRREQRLHDLLQIKPDQEGAFRAFLTAVQPQREGGERGPRGPGGPAGGPPGGPGRKGQTPMTTPERLDRMAARMAERQQHFQQIAGATKAFYAALTPDQRKAFDAMPRMMGRGGHEGHGFGRRHGGRGFEGPPPPK